MSQAIQFEMTRLLHDKKRTMHILHFLISLVTAGLWVFVWIIVALSNHLENKKTDRKIDELRMLLIRQEQSK